MELEALKRGSDGGASELPPASLPKPAQTAAITEALSSGRGGQSSITTVKTDVAWPTLTDDKSGARDVVMFYEELQLQKGVCQGEASRAQGPVSRFEVENLYERVPCRVEKRRSPFGPRGSVFPNQGQTPGFRGKAAKSERSESTANTPLCPRAGSPATSLNLSSRRRSLSWRRSA